MAQLESSCGMGPDQGLGSFAGWDGARTVVWVRGEHDAFTVSELSDTLNRAIELGDGELVVDLSGVDFMGVATVAVILRTRECLRLRSRSLALRSPSERARRVLDLCGLAS